MRRSRARVNIRCRSRIRSARLSSREKFKLVSAPPWRARLVDTLVPFRLGAAVEDLLTALDFDIDYLAIEPFSRDRTPLGKSNAPVRRHNERSWGPFARRVSGCHRTTPGRGAHADRAAKHLAQVRLV